MPPQMWALAWVADYPGRNDFLGVLLEHRRVEQLRALELAGVRCGDRSRPSRRRDAAVASAAYDRAERVVRDEVPVVPLVYGPGWALSRTGLLGAGQNGLGIVRMAGLAWAD